MCITLKPDAATFRLAQSSAFHAPAPHEIALPAQDFKTNVEVESALLPGMFMPEPRFPAGTCRCAHPRVLPPAPSAGAARENRQTCEARYTQRAL